MKQTTKTRSSGKRHANGRPAATYLALIEHFPLRPLRSERDYDVAAAVLDRLAVRPEGSLERGEQDYFDTLVLLVEDYESRNDPVDTSNVDPVDVLKFNRVIAKDIRAKDMVDLGFQ